MSHYPQPDTDSSTKIKVEFDFSIYTNKIWHKKTTDSDTSKFSKKADLAILKSEADKLHIHELKTVPTDSSKLRNVVDNVFKDCIWWTGYRSQWY